MKRAVNLRTGSSAAGSTAAVSAASRNHNMLPFESTVTEFALRMSCAFLELMIAGQIDKVVEIISKHKLSEKYILELGEYILWSGEFPKESEKFFLNAVKLFPEHFEVYEMLGHVYSWLLRDNEKALIQYNKALQLSGNNGRLEQTIKELKQ